MNTCDTCKWWSSEVTTFSRYGSSREETDITRLCTNPKFDVSDREWLFSGVEQMGMDAGCVSLNTGPKFGCNHWETK